jgi:hypothetical protein
MLTKLLHPSSSSSVILAAIFAAVASCVTVPLIPTPAVAAPCNLPLGCGQPPPDINPIGNCLDPALCGNPNQPPQGGANPPVVRAPADIAADIRAGFPLPPIVVHTAPGGDGKGTTYAKLLTYLWLTGWVTPPPQVDTQTGETVQVTATPYYANWNLVETQQNCNGPGSRTSAECSYTYNRSSPNGGRDPYSINATVYFKITWVCTAGCTGGGALDDLADPSAPYALTVGEIQAITKHG